MNEGMALWSWWSVQLRGAGVDCRQNYVLKLLLLFLGEGVQNFMPNQ